MIELYTWTTPNGVKPLIMLEETGLAYHVHAVNLRKGEQKQPEFLRINPNGKIPALVDPEGEGGEVRVFESGAMLIYLAEKTGQFLPRAGQARAEVLSWLMFQMGGIGPMMGQLAHFRDAKREDPYPFERYSSEVLRLVKVLDERLAAFPFMAGDYSIADMATFPWVRRLSALGVDPAAYPNVARWVAAQEERPAVKRALAWKPALT